MQSYNTYERGLLTFILYKTSEQTYVAGCNELCLLVEDKNRAETKGEIVKKAQSYMLNVIERDIGEHLLNQSLPDEIVDEFYEAVSKRAEYFERWTEPLESFHGRPVRREVFA